jgi:hypothetical protein
MRQTTTTVHIDLEIITLISAWRIHSSPCCWTLVRTGMADKSSRRCPIARRHQLAGVQTSMWEWTFLAAAVWAAEERAMSFFFPDKRNAIFLPVLWIRHGLNGDPE